MIENENIRDAAKTMSRWKFIALNAYIRNEKRSQISYLNPA